MSMIPRQNSPALSRPIGRFGVQAVSDGQLRTTLDVVVGLDQAEKERLSGTSGGDPIFLPVNSLLLDLDGKRVLVDVGAGGTMGPTLGQLAGNLQAIGVSPESVETILLTHLHPDHSNGLIDADGQPVYPNAELILHEREAEFWLDREPSATDTERVRNGMNMAKRVTAPYLGRMRRVADGEVFTGVSAVLQAGHTPGHTGWLLESEGDRLLIWGDIVHLASVQVPRPDAALVFDVDQAMACQSRQRVFDWVAGERIRVAGAHLGFSGFGHLRREGSGFAYQPEG